MGERPWTAVFCFFAAAAAVAAVAVAVRAAGQRHDARELPGEEGHLFHREPTRGDDRLRFRGERYAAIL